MTQSILVSGDWRIIGRYEANEAIEVGELLEFRDDGKVQKHATDEGPHFGPLLAIEDAEVGRTISDSYASGDQVKVAVPLRGSVVQIMLKDGETANETTLLASDGDGTVAVYTGQAVDEGGTATYTVHEGNVIVGYPMEDLSPSGSDELVEARVV